MLKGVKKGIKKKIKGKKGKKEDDDLFDPEQLEKYKRELEEAKKARQLDEESGGATAGASGGHEEDEEWLRFKQLTSGVDAVVNKVSEDLGRIKETSFFQRNKPSEQNKLFASERPAGAIIPTPEQEVPTGGQWVAVDHDHDVESVPGEEGAAGGDEFEDALDKVPESPPEIEPVELDDSLFDTTFVDAIAAGEIKLAYIPDSPTEPEGDDPFAISADVENVCKKIEEFEQRQKKQVNLGGAVDVLTGKGGTTGTERPRVKAAEMKPKARPRPHAINLLGDFDGVPVPTGPVGKSSEVEKPKDLFDQLLDSPSKDGSSLEGVDLVAALKKSGGDVEKKEETKGMKDVIDEFDIINQLDPMTGGGDVEPLSSSVPSSIPSSIAALLTTAPQPDPEEDELDDEFAALAAESLHKGPSPALAPEVEEKKEEEPEEDDPFDTSYVDKTAAHGKCELKILENEFLGDVQTEKGAADDDDDFDFNPRLGESPPTTLVIQNAPKANPLEDMSPLNVRAPTIEPHVKASGPTLVETEGQKGGVHDDVDVFDTSKVEVVLPGKAELKLLEAELLSSVEQAAMAPPKLPEKIATAILKANEPPPEEPDDFDFDPRKGEENNHPLDLPDVGHHAVDTAFKVMTPQQEDKSVELDPFDTSAVLASGLIPGPLELKLLEDELVTPAAEIAPVLPPTQPSPASMRRTFSDDDFDPRCGAPAPPPPPVVTTEDIFDSTMDFAVDKPLTPQLEMAPTAIPEPTLCATNADDPFDTSGVNIENYLAKSELKQVEEELLNAPPEPVRPLPVVVAVELKKPQPTFIPEPQPEPVVAHPLEAITPVNDSFKPLTPVEVSSMMSGVISVFDPTQNAVSDPFDTSFIGEGVIPGKTEIKLLEEELGVTAELQRSLSDDDFNPRAPNHPAAQLTSQPLTPMPAQTNQ